MGVPSIDCLKIAELIGVKSMLNEFVAFERLGVIIADSAVYAENPSASLETLANGTVVMTFADGTSYWCPYGLLHVSEGICAHL